MKLPTWQYCQLILFVRLITLLESFNLGKASEYRRTSAFSPESFNNAKNVEVLILQKNFNSSKVQRGFQEFVSFFDVKLKNSKIEFLQYDGISGLISHLQISKKNMIIAQNVDETVWNKDSIGVQSSDFFNYCNLGQILSKDFNKTVIFWPCPRIKDSYSFLPSFEAVSYAVKSIANKLNWTEVDIYAGDENCGLALIISTNLDIKYRIQMMSDLQYDNQFIDKVGKGIIITTSLNNVATIKALLLLQSIIYTKILLIDMVAISFNIKNDFYKNLSLNNVTPNVITNLLILTVLSDKYRHFINIALNNTGMDSVKNFRQTQNWREMENFGETTNGTSFRLFMENQNIHLLIKACQTLRSNIISLYSNYSILHVCEKIPEYLKICQSSVSTEDIELLKTEYKKNCKSSHSKLTLRKNDKTESINVLKNYTNLFNFYDFIIASILNVGSMQSDTNSSSFDKYDFIVLDIIGNSNVQYMLNSQSHVSGTGMSWRPLFILEKNELIENSFITHSILPGYDEWLIMNTFTLFNCNALCWTIIGVLIIILFCILGVSIAVGVTVRNYFLRKRLSKGPNKIVLSASDFVFPVDSRRVDEGIEAMLCCWLQQLQEFGGPEVEKPDILRGSVGSLKNLGLASTTKNNSGSSSLAKHNSTSVDMRARYNGDLVQLKEIPLVGSNELKSKAMDFLVMAHGLRHENINPLIGWLNDPNRTALVFDYCSRGSLQDVLIMDEIKLDWSFRLSLLTDLVRGMRYLHASSIRFHGSLTSRNCVVDARWVLKITDYNILTFYEAQTLRPPIKNAIELLWTAPELLRNTKSQNKIGTQLGDVYSFGIIMQEVIVRGEPYCMLSLSPQEIIAKIKKPPPLIRPSVSKGAAPPEAINIMRQCWAEMPEMRPDFNSIYERFKILNHGRKVNFVDTMFQMLEKYSNNLEELIRERTEQLDMERKKTEQLLNRMLPNSVAEKLKLGLAVDPEEFSDVTIYFSDIVGFTTIAAHCSPVQVVDLLNDLYTIFDATINAYNVYKVETIGDAYMVVSGLPQKNPDHAVQIATMALDLLHQSGRFKVKHLPGVPLQLRIGLHTGPCCAGVVGLTMPRYCLFGDTVNTASRMESSGSSWRIHMSEVTRDCLEAASGYIIEPRGLTEIKGKGPMKTYWLLGKTGFDKVLPIPPPIGESHGLDEKLIRKSINLKDREIKSCSTNPSTSQSSVLGTEVVEVKVEVTPPVRSDGSILYQHPYSFDSNSVNTISPNHNLTVDFSRVSNISPQTRMNTELSSDSSSTHNNYNRVTSSTGSSLRLYKKIEEMIDLSSPYNHYKCLSPSENNLTQYNEIKYSYGSGKSTESKPGSSRLLRRQFSLDKDDSSSQRSQTKQSFLDIPVLQDNRGSKNQIPRLHKQNSHSIAQDLEKIEEIPLSPASSQQHSSLDSNINRYSVTSKNGIEAFNYEENEEKPSVAGNDKKLSANESTARTQEITLNVEALMTR